MKLQHCAQQWADYNSSIAQCREWLQNVENIVKDVDLKSSLEEKQQQLQNIQVEFSKCHVTFQIKILHIHIYLFYFSSEHTSRC